MIGNQRQFILRPAIFNEKHFILSFVFRIYFKEKNFFFLSINIFKRIFSRKQSTTIYSNERTLSPSYIQRKKRYFHCSLFDIWLCFLSLNFKYNSVFVKDQQMMMYYYLVLLQVMFVVVK